MHTPHSHRVRFADASVFTLLWSMLCAIGVFTLLTGAPTAHAQDRFIYSNPPANAQPVRPSPRVTKQTPQQGNSVNNTHASSTATETEAPHTNNNTPTASRRVERQTQTGTQKNAQTDGIEPRVERIVIEDEGSRIKEVRVQGETQSVEVQSKSANIRPYQVDTQSENGSLADRKRTGTTNRSWRLFSF